MGRQSHANELHIRIKLPPDLSVRDPNVQDARRAALESAVIKLWQGGNMSTGLAAEQLGLGHYDYLDLLAARGIPILTEPPDLEQVDRIVQEAKASGRGR